MLGAKDVAFPRLNLLSFYLYSVAAVMLLCTLLLGGLDTGWTFYTPYSTSTGTAVVTAASVCSSPGSRRSSPGSTSSSPCTRCARRA
jgi:heme/copper-type cytochrome/quinol oxidase subunit 1